MSKIKKQFLETSQIKKVCEIMPYSFNDWSIVFNCCCCYWYEGIIKDISGCLNNDDYNYFLLKEILIAIIDCKDCMFTLPLKSRPNHQSNNLYLNYSKVQTKEKNPNSLKFHSKKLKREMIQALHRYQKKKPKIINHLRK